MPHWVVKMKMEELKLSPVFEATLRFFEFPFVVLRYFFTPHGDDHCALVLKFAMINMMYKHGSSSVFYCQIKTSATSYNPKSP